MARDLADRSLAGFYTEEMRARGARRGFRLVAFDGAKAVIAHVDFPKTHRVGKYGVDVAAIDAAVEAALAPRAGAAIYLVDEIGRMECLSERFVVRMRDLLDSRHPVVATGLGEAPADYGPANIQTGAPVGDDARPDAE